MHLGHQLNTQVLQDPTVHLLPRNGHNTGEKPLLIVDYASDLGGFHEPSEQVLSELGDQSIVVKTGVKKLKLEGISPAQWIGANARIMADLLRQGRLLPHQVPLYLSYTAKIGDLALRYSWLSVLSYDAEYRDKQAQFQFDWGIDIPHLATTRLVERPVASGRTASAKPTKTSSVCKNFNTKGCTWDGCTYRHVCSEPGCGKAHSRHSHNKA